MTECLARLSHEKALRVNSFSGRLFQSLPLLGEEISAGSVLSFSIESSFSRDWDRLVLRPEPVSRGRVDVYFPTVFFFYFSQCIFLGRFSLFTCRSKVTPSGTDDYPINVGTDGDQAQNSRELLDSF